MAELSEQEIDTLRKLGVYLKDKCDYCEKAIRRTIRWVNTSGEVFCSDECRAAQDGEHISAHEREQAEKRETKRRKRHIAEVQPEEDEDEKDELTTEQRVAQGLLRCRKCLTGILEEADDDPSIRKCNNCGAKFKRKTA